MNARMIKTVYIFRVFKWENRPRFRELPGNSHDLHLETQENSRNFALNFCKNPALRLQSATPLESEIIQYKLK